MPKRDDDADHRAALGDAPLFGAPKLPRNPRPTQVKAAERVAPRMFTQRARVLSIIREYSQFEVNPGITDEAIADALCMSLNSVRPRRLELLEAGWVKDSGRTRKTRSGSDAIVWCYVEEDER